MRLQNRPFLSSKNSHFQNEAKCETFVVKMSFICIIKNHFHINGFALSLALKVRFFGTRKRAYSRPETLYSGYQTRALVDVHETAGLNRRKNFVIFGRSDVRK